MKENKGKGRKNGREGDGRKGKEGGREVGWWERQREGGREGENERKKRGEMKFPAQQGRPQTFF